jgi:hypothetical protein
VLGLTKGSDSLSLCVLGVGDSITNDGLEEGLEDTTGLFVDHGRDTLDTTTTSETSNGRLGDTLDVVSKNLAMTLGTSFSEALAAFSACKRSESQYVSCYIESACVLHVKFMIK